MDCASLYDLTTSGFPIFRHVLEALGWAAVIFVIYKSFSALAPKYLQSLANPRRAYLVLSITLAWVMILRPAAAYLHYREIMSGATSGKMVFLEGPIYQYRLLPEQNEEFSVCGREFTYDPKSVGLYQTLERSQKLRDGEFVRIGFVGKDVVQLERCPHLPRMCSK